MKPRIIAGRVGAAQIESPQLRKAEILDPGRLAFQPISVSARQSRIEPEIVVHHDDPVGGKLDIQLGAVAAQRDGMPECCQRVFRSQACAAAMRDSERRHVSDAREQTVQIPAGCMAPLRPFVIRIR